MDLTYKFIPVSITILIMVAGFPTSVLGGTQIELGLGENRFFLGERFLITFKDVVYWMAGMCMGLLFATTFIFITDYDGALTAMKAKKAGSSRNRNGTGEKENGESRDARLIGSKKYPTHIEERVLQAIHTEPENYVGRQGRLIGGKRLPTGMEERVLTKLESPENTFTQEDSSKEDDGEQSAVLQVFKILFSLPPSPQDEPEYS